MNTKGHTLINAGLILSAGLGGLVLTTTTVANAGTLQASGGSVFNLKSDTMIGGVLRANGGGRLRIADSGSVLDGFDAGAITLGGKLAIANGNSLTVEGALDMVLNFGTTSQTGVINFFSGATALVIGADNATITGGLLALGASGPSQIEGVVTSPGGVAQVSTLTTTGTIQGAGTIGTNLALVNTGTIDATGANALLLAPGNGAVAGSNTIVNSGTLEATNKKLATTGGLELNNLVIANGATGVIEASGAHSHVDLQNARINGGTVEASKGGMITLYSGNVILGAALLAATGSFVNLEGATIAGGTLQTAGTGVMRAIYGDTTLDGTSLAVTNQGR